MRRCNKRAAEPACLAELRTARPDAKWDELRNEQQGCYTVIRQALREDQSCLCAYCESRLSADNEQIAHFHPKSDCDGERNWALDWANLWLACKGGTQSWLSDHDNYPVPANRSCDEAKENRCLEGLILRPDEIPASPPIFRFEQWPERLEIRADDEACRAAGIAPEKVARTVAELNLNCGRLAEARLAHHRALEQAKKRLRQSGRRSLADLVSLAAAHLRRNAQGCLPGFPTVTRWSLGIAAERCLEQAG